ncbi:hypothetical protein GLYMA_09G097402v4 [Glycine max]|nr:hypothetical protein GLYMA_09G097402v4 [Glycine max]KAG4388061.1 hypothetical protein GLYMA_09G097402v4 [Glycine max]KAH1042300.1 hypothetical protein GYH30_024556 [Glycine max]KAH1042301.1 hypothetical protein GYH30_024556 [Glycine max]
MKNPLNSENKLKGISDKRKRCLLSLHHFFHANTTLTVTSLFTIPLFMWRHDGGRRTRSFLSSLSLSWYCPRRFHFSHHFLTRSPLFLHISVRVKVHRALLIADVGFIAPHSL